MTDFLDSDQRPFVNHCAEATLLCFQATTTIRLYWNPFRLVSRSGAYGTRSTTCWGLALESQRNRCLIVGEELGALPDGFRERMADTGIMSYRLMILERYPDGLFRRPSHILARQLLHLRLTMCRRSEAGGKDGTSRFAERLASGPERRLSKKRNHRQDDYVLLLAALRDQQLDIGTLTAAKERDAAAIADLIVAIEQFLARSPSALMVANLTDMLAEVVQINVPRHSVGTSELTPLLPITCGSNHDRHCQRVPQVRSPA